MISLKLKGVLFSAKNKEEKITLKQGIVARPRGKDSDLRGMGLCFTEMGAWIILKVCWLHLLVSHIP